MLERDIEKRSCDWAERRGWWQRKFKTPFRKNAPDRIFLNPIQDTPLCVVLFIEFKATGKDASDAQKIEHSTMRAKGLDVRVCDNVEKFKSIITDIETHMAQTVRIQDFLDNDDAKVLVAHAKDIEHLRSGELGTIEGPTIHETSEPSEFPEIEDIVSAQDSWLDD